MAAAVPLDAASYPALNSTGKRNTVSTDVSLTSEPLSVLSLDTTVSRDVTLTSEPLSVHSVDTYPPKNNSINQHEVLLEDDIQQDTNKAATPSSTTSPMPPDEHYPEGGFGWTVLAATFAISFWTIGMNFTWGVYQEYFLTFHVFPNTDARKLAAVAGVLTGCICAAAPAVVYMISHISLAVVLAFGVVLCGFGIITTSFATQYWHLYLTMAVPFGFGSCILYFTSTTILAQYFRMRRAFVTGVAASGSGIGGVALAPLQRWMMGHFGFQTSTRIVGSVMMVCLSIAVCFVRPYVHPEESPQSHAESNPSGMTEGEPPVSASLDKSMDKEMASREDQSGIAQSNPVKAHRIRQSSTVKIALDTSVFKHIEYVLILLAAFFFLLTYMVPAIMLPSYSITINLTSLQGASLISVFSGASIFTRIAFGYVADQIGIFNTILACQFATTLSCFAIWLPATGYALLIIFMIIYGGCAGALFVLIPVAASKSVDRTRMASAMSFVFFVFTAGGVVGPPIAQAIVEANDGHFRGVIVYMGTMNAIGFVIVAVIRMRENTRFLVVL